jgi:hypothetical protein
LDSPESLLEKDAEEFIQEEEDSDEVLELQSLKNQHDPQ